MRFPILLAALLMTGCGSANVFQSSSSGSGSLPQLSAESILDRLPEMPEELHTLTAEALVSVSHPDENGRFTARIAYRQGDSMLVRVRFPLGVEGARVLVTADSAFVYDRIDNRLVAGRPETISELLPIAVAATNLVETATGFARPSSSAAWDVSRDSTRYRLDSRDGRWRMFVDPTISRIAYLEERDPDGTIVEQRWYTEFRRFSGLLLPSRMNLSRPPQDTRLSMALRRLDTEPRDLDFGLGLKQDTRRVVLADRP